MSSLKKLPPEVVRELLRHVNHAPKRSEALQPQPQTSSTMKWVLGGCLTLTAAAGSFPLVAHWWIGNLNEKDQALTGPQVRRGAFMNSGSKDIGKDPNWDFRTGQYKKDAGYYAMYQEDEEQRKQKKLSAEFFAAPNLDKHEEAMEAFAKGERRRNQSA